MLKIKNTVTIKKREKAKLFFYEIEIEYLTTRPGLIKNNRHGQVGYAYSDCVLCTFEQLNKYIIPMIEKAMKKAGGQMLDVLLVSKS